MKTPATALLLLFPSSALCGGADTELALTGLDPVALCGGEEKAGVDGLDASFGRYHYRFANAENRARFLAEPERFGIQWGGACARMGPLSGRGSPDRWTVYGGRTYIFASDGCREGFLAAPERFVPPPDERPAVTPGALARGAEWIGKAVAAHGGEAAVDGKRALRLAAVGAQGGWTHEQELLVTAAGDVRRLSAWTPPEPEDETSDTVWVVADRAFTIESGQVFDLSPAERTDVRRYGQREPLALLWARRGEGFQAVQRGAGKLGERETVDVLVRAAGLDTTLHLAPEDGRILGLSWRGRPMDGVTRDVQETFTDYRTVDGVLLPVARTVTIDGKASESMAVAWDAAELLDAAPADAFVPPERD